MAATAGYQAGVETNATQISYAVEATWGVAPAVQFQAIRYTSESLKLTKTRSRPSEITGTREAAQAATTQQSAAGSINYALSYATFDDFISVVLQSDWQAAQAIAGIAGDITLTNTSGVITLTSTLTTKFANLSQGQWIRLLGYTNAANNSFWFVSVKTDNSHLTLTGPNSATAVTETPTGALAQIRASTVKNGTTFKSLFIQQMFSSTMFLSYAGSYVSRWTLTGGINSFPNGAFDIVAKGEAKGTTNGSTGAVLAAPTGRVMDPVAGWVQATWNEAAIGAAIDQFSLTVENTGAAAELAMGSASAAGILGGTLMASASFRAYFKDFTQYDLFTSEATGRLAFILKDAANNAYVVTFLQAVLMVEITAGGQGTAVYATVTVEGGPSGNGTIVVDRLPAS